MYRLWSVKSYSTNSVFASNYREKKVRNKWAKMSIDKSKQIFNVVALCLVWYIVSSTNNVIGKMVLSTFPYPMTVTMVQLTSITLYSGPFFNLWGVRKYADISWNYYFKLIIPLALGKFFASVTSHISIWKVPVSYAHTGESHSKSLKFRNRCQSSEVGENK